EPMGRCVPLTESLEHVRKERGIDALARVADDDFHLPVGAQHTDLHAAASRSELDRVRKQVPEDLLQAVGVAEYGSETPRERGVDADLLRLSGGPHAVERSVQHLIQLEGTDLEPELAGHDARDV